MLIVHHPQVQVQVLMHQMFLLMHLVNSVKSEKQKLCRNMKHHYYRLLWAVNRKLLIFQRITNNNL